MSGFEESLVWVKDKEGKDFICILNSECNEALNGNRKLPHSLEELSMCERVGCREVEEVLGGGWW